MTRGPSAFWARAFGVFSFLTFAACLVLAITFTTGSTGYVDSIHLKDPKGTAGQLFGILVLWPLTLCLAFGLYWFERHVLSQLDALAKASELWEKVEDELKITPLKRGDPKADELIKGIAKLKPESARIVRAARSWLDPSPDSDAEMVIEGAANRCRQHLSLLQAVASILVLIGLVGNFFGLSEAVSRMHELANFTQGSQIVDNTPTTGTTTSNRISHTSVQAPKPTVKTSSSETAGQSISNITAGLQVVVVSSVLGIGGMIVLLLFVSIFRNFFNHQVGEEVLLMATEIGSAVRAGSNDSQALMSLGERLAAFEAERRDLSKLTAQLDRTLNRVLEAEDSKFEGFRVALVNLTNFLESRNEGLTALLTSAVATSQMMEGMALNINRVGEGLAGMVDSQSKTLADLGTYASLVRAMAEDQNANSEKRHRQLVDALASQLDERLQDWLKRVDADRDSTLKRTEDALHHVQEGQSKLVKHLLAEGSQQTEDNRKYLSDLQEKTRASLGDLQTEWTSLLKDWLKKFNEAETQLSESQNLARTDLATRLDAVAEALRDKLPEAGDALRSISTEVRGSYGDLQKELSTLLGSVRSLSEAQGASSQHNRAILEEAVKTLQATRQNILELQDRWNVNVEEVAREIFRAWLEQQSPDSGSGVLAEELRGITSKLSHLAEHSKNGSSGKVCSSCGSLNQAEEAYCKSCGVALLNALPAGSFPVRILVERLEALQKTMEKEPVPLTIDPGPFESLKASIISLNADLQKSRFRDSSLTGFRPARTLVPEESRPDPIDSLPAEEAQPTPVEEVPESPAPKQSFWSRLLRKKP